MTVCITLGPNTHQSFQVQYHTTLRYVTLRYRSYVPWNIMEPNALVVSITDLEQSGGDATPFIIVDGKEATAGPHGQNGKDKANDGDQGNEKQRASIRHR